MSPHCYIIPPIFITLFIFLTILLNCYDSNESLIVQFDQRLQQCLFNHSVNPKVLVQRNLSSQLYQRLNYQWNEYTGHKTPSGYLVAQKVADIQAAVKCGRALNIKVVPKSGGHSFEKYSYGDSNSLVIDLQLLNSISIDHKNKTVDLGPGHLLGPLAWSLYKDGNEFGIPSGLCPSVGISLALGGGFGNLPRYYGLTSDAILELDLVDPAGNLLTVNQNTNPDLFWALRGGGGSASFGIVSRFRLKLFQAPKIIIFSTITYEIDDFPQVFTTWQSLFSSNPPNTINSMLTINSTHAIVDLSEVQPDGEETEQLRQSLAQFPRSGVSFFVEKLTYPEYLLYTVYPYAEFYGLDQPQPPDLLNITRESFPIGFFKTKSFFVGSPITSSTRLKKLTSLIKKMPDGSNMVCEAFGGIINERTPSETAFIHRHNLFHATIGYSGPDYETIGRSWINSFFDSTQSLLNHNESYQNYADKELENHLQRYYGSNLERLVEIKAKVDPDNYFHSPESIPVKL